MEPNDSTTNQRKDTRSTSQSPPLQGASGSESSGPELNSGSTAQNAGDLGNEAKKAAQARAEEGAETAKKTFSSTASHTAEALGRAAESLRDQGEGTLAQTTTSIASGLSDYAKRLEKRSAEDLIQDVARLARENPTLFVLGSVGIGIVLSRLFKASSESAGRYN